MARLQPATGVEAALQFSREMGPAEAPRKLPLVEAENARLKAENQLLREQNQSLQHNLELALQAKGVGTTVSVSA